MNYVDNRGLRAIAVASPPWTVRFNLALELTCDVEAESVAAALNTVADASGVRCEVQFERLADPWPKMSVMDAMRGEVVVAVLVSVVANGKKTALSRFLDGVQVTVCSHFDAEIRSIMLSGPPHVVG